ncbi:restriction endonuclease subunit S [Sporolactobacillus inulinus]|uniref:Type I restriction modification DNA specificity domain-containing protein n=1 Tax=Sporolactobacillus inulinus CASD TaxID=1069536 RepID=A0A0U1QNZ9_9BACL|nr:restriction endonuclease subunit S [Sporolactobacillus inulinus]KLI02346.1 hypothetical protein SINU_08495 [Sporolactobacillus inulinus CASD]GEB77011.1 restriction endonuclease [Sporolactobacillus inulinus]
MEKRRVAPEIRFDGFFDDWEQRKLSDIKDVRDGTHDSPRYFQEGHPLVTSKNLTESGLDFVDVSFISDEDFEAIIRRSKVDKGDIILGMIGTIGNPVIVDRDDFAIKNVALIKVGGETPNSFLIQQLKSPVFEKYIRVENAGNTQKFLGLSKIRDYVFLAPSVEEMKRIGAFFASLDQTIALHQKKLDRLQCLKKAFLQLMFPQNDGETEPRLRFANFVSEWEQRKLKDLAEFSKGNGCSKSNLTDEGNPVILYGRLYTKYETVIESVDTFTIEKENTVISQGNEVIVPASGETSEDISRASTVSKPGIILGGDLNIIRPSNEIDPVFLALTISNGKQKKEISKRAQGKSVVHLHNSDLKEVNLLFPKKEEQTRIGDFFQKIDHTIALHQTKLEKLQSLKKAYLQKMFI